MTNGTKGWEGLWEVKTGCNLGLLGTPSLFDTEASASSLVTACFAAACFANSSRKRFSSTSSSCRWSSISFFAASNCCCFCFKAWKGSCALPSMSDCCCCTICSCISCWDRISARTLAWCCSLVFMSSMFCLCC